MRFERFLLFTTLAAGAVSLTFLDACSTARHTIVHWSYSGEGGPKRWSELDPRFRQCTSGHRQSPIELPAEPPEPEPGAPVFDYHPSEAVVTDNGHALQVDLAPTSQVVIEGKTYTLAQFHFHAPSEHHLGRKSYPLELHLVHEAPDGLLAVVAVFIEEGDGDNGALSKLLDSLSEELHLPASQHAFDPGLLLPSERRMYRYVGSLTTPPCTEGVQWNVFSAPIQASHAFIDRLLHVHMNNARPIQPRDGRFIHG